MSNNVEMGSIPKYDNRAYDPYDRSSTDYSIDSEAYGSSREPAHMRSRGPSGSGQNQPETKWPGRLKTCLKCLCCLMVMYAIAYVAMKFYRGEKIVTLFSEGPKPCPEFETRTSRGTCEPRICGDNEILKPNGECYKCLYGEHAVFINGNMKTGVCTGK